jgi:glycosyltransferase involved in cell wall biosynthesis
VLARWTARIIAVSPSEADLLRDRRIASGARVVVIPNGIEVDVPSADADLRSRIGVPADAPLVGTVARLVPQKAPERFVALAAALHHRRPDAHFVLIGDGVLRAEIDRAVAADGIASWFHRVAGVPDAATVAAELDVFVLTSRFEGGPYAPLEAMRAGTPVVLTDVVGNRDVVEHGISGFLVPEHPLDGLVRAVDDLLTDPARRAEIGAAGRARVRDRFDVRKTGGAVARVYGSLVA